MLLGGAQAAQTNPKGGSPCILKGVPVHFEGGVSPCILRGSPCIFEGGGPRAVGIVWKAENVRNGVGSGGKSRIPGSLN